MYKEKTIEADNPKLNNGYFCAKKKKINREFLSWLSG